MYDTDNESLQCSNINIFQHLRQYIFGIQYNFVQNYNDFQGAFATDHTLFLSFPGTSESVTQINIKAGQSNARKKDQIKEQASTKKS